VPLVEVRSVVLMSLRSTASGSKWN
jgi:hypothetical protein